MKQIFTKYFAILLFLNISVLAFSQQTIIKFNNANSKSELEGVSVLITDISGNNKTTQQFTDKNGEIKIDKISGSKVILEARLVGFIPIKTTIELKAEQTLSMTKDVLNIEQVTITGTRTPQTLKSSPVLTQLITADEIKNVDAQTLPDILEVEMPGIEMASHGGVPVMNMMGLETQYSLILIDGERLAKGLQKTIDYSRINADNIERIEIIRGAGSALYGSEAIGGVINIITKKANKKFDVSANVRYKELNSKDHTQLDLDNADDDYSKKFYKNIDKQNINANLNIGYKGKKINSSTFFNFKTVDAYKLSDTKLRTRYYKSGDIMQEKMPDNNKYYQTPVNGYQDFTLSQKLGYDISDKWMVNISGSFYNHDEYDFHNDAIHDLYQSYNANGKITYLLNDKSSFNLSYNTDIYQRFDYSEKAKEKNKNHSNDYHSFKLNYMSKIGRHNLFAEFEDLYQTLTTDKFVAKNLTSKYTNNMVIVLQDQFKWTDDFMLIAGIRTGYHSAYKIHASPSISAKYTINKINLRATYARAFRSPDLKELYMNWSHLGMFQIEGSADLKPETSNYYSLSLDFVDIAKNLNMTLIGSYNDVQNKIDGVWTNSETIYRYVNFHNAQIFSVEALVKWYFLNHFKLKAGYIFLNSVKSADAQDLSSMSPMSLNLQFEYNLTKNKYRLNANISGKLTGKKTFNVLDDNDTYGHKDEYYEVRYPMYSIWNLTINQYFGKHFKLGLGIKNILDYTAPIVTFNTSNTPGRKFFVSVGYNL